MDGPFYVDSKPPFINTDPAAITLTTSLQPIVPTGILPQLPANYFNWVGKAMRLRMYGEYTSAATPGTGQLSFYLGNNTASNGTLLIGQNWTYTANQSKFSFFVDLNIRCRALGVSGSLFAMGHLMFAVTGFFMIPSNTPVATTVDLTQSYFLSPQWSRSGSTVETVQVHDYSLEALN